MAESGFKRESTVQVGICRTAEVVKWVCELVGGFRLSGSGSRGLQWRCLMRISSFRVQCFDSARKGISTEVTISLSPRFLVTFRINSFVLLKKLDAEPQNRLEVAFRRLKYRGRDTGHNPAASTSKLL